MRNKRNLILAIGLGGLIILGSGGEALAGKGAGRQQGAGIQNRTQSAQQSQAQSRDRVRRQDGTFLSTGTTANGATSRPGNGRGLQDGSGAAAPLP